MGYKNGQDEHFAYLLGWCVECVMNSVTKYLKKIIMKISLFIGTDIQADTKDKIKAITY